MSQDADSLPGWPPAPDKVVPPQQADGQQPPPGGTLSLSHMTICGQQCSEIHLWSTAEFAALSAPASVLREWLLRPLHCHPCMVQSAR